MKQIKQELGFPGYLYVYYVKSHHCGALLFERFFVPSRMGFSKNKVLLTIDYILKIIFIFAI